MPDTSAFMLGAISAGLQPGLLGIKPTITHEVEDRIPNSALQKVAEDVLAAARLSLTAVVASPDSITREGSAEQAFAVFVKQTPAAVAAQPRAKALLSADKLAKEAVFGRFATKPADVARESGFPRLIEDEKPLSIDLNALGISAPQISVPVSALTRNADGRVEIAAGTPGLTSFEEALTTGGTDFGVGGRGGRQGLRGRLARRQNRDAARPHQVRRAMGRCEQGRSVRIRHRRRRVRGAGGHQQASDVDPNSSLQ